MKKPNVLYIFADQLRYDSVGCNGNRLVQTPTIDRLAREGIVFDQALSSCPICSPYRGQLLTGRYSHANGVIDNEYRMFDNQTTLADAFRADGYQTAYIGKWHLGYGPYDEPARRGFDDFIGYNMSHLYYDVSYWRNEEGPFKMVDYAPYVETQLTLDYLQDHLQARPEQPFCVVLAWGPPHWSPLSSGREYGEYPQEFNIYDPKDVVLPDNVPVQYQDFARREIADYYAMVSSLDACLARILDALEEWGIAEDTIVVFTSDHGDHLSSHGLGKPYDEWMHHTLRASKATPYDESVRVPFVLRYPAQVRGNQRTDTLYGSVDIMPTLLGLCDAGIPDGVQGKDLSHVVLDQPGEDPDSVYLQILGPGWPNRTKWVGLWRGVRTQRYVYARWQDRDGMRLLFDRETDPAEMHNLADDKDYVDIVNEMEARLQRWIKETNDPFDTGTRLPVTDMLDLGQRFTHDNWYDQAPQGYADALHAPTKG